MPRKRPACDALKNAHRRLASIVMMRQKAPDEMSNNVPTQVTGSGKNAEKRSYVSDTS
jgi:hypothetical protein